VQRRLAVSSNGPQTMQNIIEHAFEVVFFPRENFVVHANRNHPDPSLAGAWEWRNGRDGSTAWEPSRGLGGKAEVALHGGGHSATLGALLRGQMGDGRWEMGGHTYERAYHTAGAIRHHRYAPDPTRPLRRHGRGSRAWRGHAGAVARERHATGRDCPTR